ncbi:hypothetical protein AB0I53_21730 [Saccharopolyspora sp. NPDC050389]|uniref:hypothetical protein n=1 Tax=Saccharopolyspora sp. NPDC050389 TaxID=3155516 RepID=UPI0033C81F69
MIARRAVLVGLLLIPLVAGCTAEPPETPASSSPSPSALPGPPAPLPGSTPPGTRLRFGDKAVITVGWDDAPSRVGVIVTGVEMAPPEDTAALRSAFPESVSRWAYFIRTVRVNEDGETSGNSGPSVYGELGDGDAGEFRLLNSNLYLPHCTVHIHPPADWYAPGGRFETCQVVFADPDRVRLHIDGGDIYWE